MQEFFEHLKLELTDIQEDVTSADLHIAGGKAGDYGCGPGVTTLALMISLDLAEAIGVDKDPLAVKQAQGLFEEAKNEISSPKSHQQQVAISSAFEHLAENRRAPQFRVADILSGENLPSSLDLAYCKKVLTPIYLGEFGNQHAGQAGVATAIQQIAATLNTGGWIIAIEKASGADFRPLFEEAGLQVISATRFEREEINGGKRITLYKTQFNKYIYQKY